MRGGRGKAKIILCSHRCLLSLLMPVHLSDEFSSMGGLLAADALIEFVQTRPNPTAPLWPNIIACLAYDTPVSQSLLFSFVVQSC